MTGTGAGRRQYVQGIWCGRYEYLKTMKVRDEKKLTSIPNKKYLKSTIIEMGIGDCKESVSPKLDKASMDGNNKETDEEQTARFRSSVLTLLYLSNERTDIQSTVRFLCTKLESITALEMRQLKRLLRYVKGTEDMATVFEVRDNNDKREWRKHQNTVNWDDFRLAQKKGLKFYQTRSNAIILYNTLPAYCIPKAIKMETGEIIYEKVYESPRQPPKISLRDNWMKEFGSEVAGQAESSQPTQPNPNPIYRTGRPVMTEQTSRSSAQEIDTRFSLGCKNINLFVKCLEKDKRHRQKRRCRSR